MTAEVAVPPAGEPPPSLGSNVRRGAMWTVGSSMLMRLSNVALMAVVARLIVPEEFGVFTLAMTAFAFVSSVAELGIGSAAARADLDLDKIAPTVTTIASTSSFVLGGLMAAFAAPIARFLGSSEATQPLRILALVVAMIGPFAVPGAQLQREFHQRRVFLADLVSFVPATVVLLAILLSHGDGAVAFAWSRVTGQLTAGLVMCTGVSRLYRPGFARDQLRLLFGFGMPLAGASLLGMVVGNVDYLFVSRLLDVNAVGIYTLGGNVAGWASSAIGSMLNGVVLPAFSTVKRDPALLRASIRRGVRVVAVVACLICAMTAGLARPLIDLLYGPQWLAAAPVLMVLALYGVATVLNLLLGNIVTAMGRTGAMFGVQVAVLIVLVPALYIGIDRGGIVGAAWAHVSVMVVVTLPVYLRTLRRTTGTLARSVLGELTPPLVAGVLAGFAAHLLTLLPVPVLAQFLIGGTVGTSLYVLLMARGLIDVVGSRLVPAPVWRAVEVTEPLRRWLSWWQDSGPADFELSEVGLVAGEAAAVPWEAIGADVDVAEAAPPELGGRSRTTNHDPSDGGPR